MSFKLYFIHCSGENMYTLLSYLALMVNGHEDMKKVPALKKSLITKMSLHMRISCNRERFF